MSKTVFLKVTSAFLVAGEIARVGEVVEVDHTDAKDLLHRGKAVLVELDPADQLDDAVEVPEGAEQPEADAVAPEAEQPAAEQPAEAVEQPAAETPEPKAKGGKKGGK